MCREAGTLLADRATDSGIDALHLEMAVGVAALSKLPVTLRLEPVR